MQGLGGFGFRQVRVLNISREGFGRWLGFRGLSLGFLGQGFF